MKKTYDRHPCRSTISIKIRDSNWNFEISKAKCSHSILMQVGQVQMGSGPVAGSKGTAKKGGKKNALASFD